MTCPACQNQNNFKKNIYTTFDKKEDYNVYECQKCGLAFLYPIIDFKKIEEDYYNEFYHAFKIVGRRRSLVRKLKDFFKKNALDQYLGYGPQKFWQKITYPFFIRISFYPRRVPGGKFLGVGSGAGKQLLYNQELGWDVYGVDISAIAVEVAKAQGLTQIYQGTLEDAKFMSEYFNVVDMHHVLEHLGSPNETLEEIRRILKRGGELIITVPNYSSLAKKVFGKYWGGWDIPRHFLFFNKTNLTLMLERNGFEVSEVWHSDTWRGFSAGLAYLIFRAKARKYEKYFLPLGIFCDLFFDPLFQKFGWGDQLTIKARKL